jgi:hypothetical protein
MRLYVIDDYRSRDVFYPKGVVLEVPAETAVFLMADAPGCFSLSAPSVSIETVTEEISAPPADKMIRRSKTK